MNWGETKEIIDEMKKRTLMEAFSLKIQPDIQPGICDSKFGGVPYWDMKKPYPTDYNGEKLILLAQINLDQIEKNELLPENGMLQFFTGLDDVFGMNFDNPDVQDTFRVIYHESVDYSITNEQILRLNPPISTNPDIEEYTPLWKECAVKIEKTKAYMGESDYRFDTLFGETAHEKFNIKFDSAFNLLDEDDYNKMVEELSTTGHWMLGYPFFTQQDPRTYEEKYRYYDTLLFQMDSDFINKEDYVLWGDCGVANFFINHEDLKRKDFSKVLYNWDCC